MKCVSYRWFPGTDGGVGVIAGATLIIVPVVVDIEAGVESTLVAFLVELL